ncbi:MAG: hypothetical protein WC570_04645 [Patescibacteria group bacterium]
MPLEINNDACKDGEMLSSIKFHEIDGRFVIGKSMKLSELRPLPPVVICENNFPLMDLVDSINKTDVPPACVLERSNNVGKVGSGKVEIDYVPVVVNEEGIKGILSGPNVLQNRKIVILSQGLQAEWNCISNQWIQEILHGYGICTLSYDYSGDVGIEKRSYDLVKNFEYLKRWGYKVGGYGSSYGGLALLLASSQLCDTGSNFEVIANRTIIPKLNDTLVKDLRGKTGNSAIDLKYIQCNIGQVVSQLNEGGLRVTERELSAVCEGQYNLDKVVDKIICPHLNVQGSFDEKVDIYAVNQVMKQISKQNHDNYMVEISGANHGCEHLDHYKIQLYLLASFLIEKMRG